MISSLGGRCPKKFLSLDCGFDGLGCGPDGSAGESSAVEIRWVSSLSRLTPSPLRTLIVLARLALRLRIFSRSAWSVENVRSNLGEGGRSSSSGYTVHRDEQGFYPQNGRSRLTKARSSRYWWHLSEDLMQRLCPLTARSNTPQCQSVIPNEVACWRVADGEDLGLRQRFNVYPIS